MGLDTTHGCWHGAYSAFMRWRSKLAEVAGLPPLDLMEGFFSGQEVNRSSGAIPTFYLDPHASQLARNSLQQIETQLPIRWETLKPDPALYFLLSHSDCDGDIPAEICGPLADRLAELLPLFPEGDGGGHIGVWKEKTQQFIDGLRDAASKGEAVEFH